MHCLIVSPDAHRALARATLARAAGATAEVAGGGLHALTQIERGRPDLVILDPALDDLTPGDLLEILRDDPATRTTPVLISGQPPSPDAAPADLWFPPQLSPAETLARALEAAGHPPLPWTAPEQAPLSGQLQDLDLTELILCVHGLHLSGLLLLRGPQRGGQLTFRQGELLDAEDGPDHGPAGFARLLEPGRAGDFHFHPLEARALQAYPRGLQMPTAQLLMEAAVQRDHLHALETSP
ncbi:DUF4388 domain-containing protein [Deinococcus budaensis]|uniref:CheY-like chemotaxis protein n=1 Tax=Deinococcus budaensis TaxID=1665626 RepID=A0A7W8GFM5_9DEIO|nr:DUF4388 domain-containing protein [Deinococcus budaensis]MBB5234782.1 CheY-like chemotaxis protein [Deinococcus budaensis]